jgi:PAS domain S-box-containing protein
MTKLGGMGKSHTTTRFWHRRSSEAVILVSFVVVALYLWGLTGGATELNKSIHVPLVAGIIGAISLVIASVTYFITPLQQLNQAAILNYALLLATITTLVVTTNGISSTFLSLLVASLAFASFFGIGGVIIGALSLAVFVVNQYIAGAVTPSQIVAISLLGGTPLIGSFIIWGRHEGESTNDETQEDRSYHELASELSQVSGKSEVVINAIGEGVLALDGQGVIQLINPAAEQLLGWKKSDSLNLSYKSILKILNTKNQEVDSANDPVAQALNTNKPISSDNFSLQTQSGKSFLASISVSPVGQLGKGVIVVFRDVTVEKSDERQRAEFISTASHEMRTPVASIEGYLGLALNPATANIDEKARDFITKAHESAQHLGRLFADLLDVSKADDSRLKNDPKVVDVVPFIHDIVQGLTPKGVEKGLHVIYKPMPDDDENDHEAVHKLNPVFYANVDNDHLREVVQNLVENAIKYTLKGDVVIDVTGDDGHITISVADTGIGIPREDQAHLFQKFYRVDNSDTREIGGTGLGLYLCRRLTETIGGRLWVESEYKRGSTFFVEIPRIDHDEAQRLIEQASIEAEREAELEQQEVIHDAEVKHEEFEAANAPDAPIRPAAPIDIVTNPTARPAQPMPTIIPQPVPEPTLPQYAAPQSYIVSSEPSVTQSAITPTPAYEPAPLSQPAPMQEMEPPTRHPVVSTVNTPLSAIESNPSQYLTRRGAGITVPPRQ